MSTMKQLKAELIADLQLCISYEPNRENDILCMVERYLKCKKERGDILENLHCLLDSKPYQNPYAVYYFYGQKEIEALDEILETYLERTVTMVDFIRTITQINALHAQCGGELIDEWRSITLEEFLLLGASTMPLAEDLLATHKRW